jgi:hypothetical protein
MARTSWAPEPTATRTNSTPASDVSTARQIGATVRRSDSVRKERTQAAPAARRSAAITSTRSTVVAKT